MRFKLKKANNWAGVSRFSRVNCETNCDWIVIVCLINYGEINIKYKNKYDYKINMFFFLSERCILSILIGTLREKNNKE